MKFSILSKWLVGIMFAVVTSFSVPALALDTGLQSIDKPEVTIHFGNLFSTVEGQGEGIAEITAQANLSDAPLTFSESMHTAGCVHSEYQLRSYGTVAIRPHVEFRDRYTAAKSSRVERVGKVPLVSV